jgi:glycosyltransferase involved in cell wall biosynthesis
MASFGPGYSPYASKLQVAAERYCGRFTDVIVCVGNELKDRYVAHSIGEPGRYAIMRTPIDIDAFARTRAFSGLERAGLRASFGVTAETPLVVAIGALEPRKRHALMLDRLKPALHAGSFSVAIAGDGPERSALEEQIAAERIDRSVRLLGQTSRIIDLLGCADALVLTSRVEGVPRVVIEALAAGVPVIAMDVEGLRELPDAPITIVPSDGRGLAEAVERVVDAPPPALPLEALEQWRPTAVDQQIAAVYEQLKVTRAVAPW